MTLIGQAPLLPTPVMLMLPSGGTVRVVARRQPVTDRMDWFLYPHPSIVSAGPHVGTELNDALATLRADTGL